MFTRTNNRTIWLIIGLSLCWSLFLALDIAPILRGGYGWRWPYSSLENPERILPLFITLFIGIGIGIRLLYLERARWIILWSMALGIGLCLTSIYVTERDVYFELYTRTISGGTTGWHYASTDIDNLDETLSDWPNFMHQYVGQSSHMTTSPPGFPLIYYTGTKLFSLNENIANKVGRPLRADQCHNDRIVGWSLYPGYTNAELASAWLGILMPLWGVLVILPLYWLGREFFSDQTARWSSLWWTLVPSFLMFTPNPTPIYAFIGLSVLGLLLKGMRDQQSLWILLAGIIMSLGTFLHFSTLPIIFLAGLFVISHEIAENSIKNINWVRLIKRGLWFSIGLITLWLAYLMVSGVFVWEVFSQSINEHLSLDRPYIPWLILHLNDFFMFSGWTFSILAGFGFWRIIRQNRADNHYIPSITLTVSVVITLLMMNFSGTTQGESGRIWLFLSPFLLLMASDYIVKTTGNNIHIKIAVTACQGILLLIMVAYLQVIGSGMSKPPDNPPSTIAIQNNVIQSNAVFGNVLQLQSFSGYIEMREGNNEQQATLHIWLNWESNGQLEIPYYLSYIPVKPNGETLQAEVRQPFENDYPITCWLPDSGLIQEYVTIPLLAEEISGGWWVSISLISRNAIILPVIENDGSHDQQIGIGPFRLE